MLIFSKLNIVHVRLLFCSSIVVKRLAKVNLQAKEAGTKVLAS
ncbi:hypothetical protein SPADD19_02031 [Streptococcus parasanguinis]|nr:hypothetical protein SPADD19_02031 [Streptococcus parasanguinis]